MYIFIKKTYQTLLFLTKVKRLIFINNIFIFFKIFIIRLFFSYPQVRNLIKSKKSKNINSKEFFDNQNSYSGDIIKNLDLYGFSEHSLKIDLTNKIINEIPKIVKKISFKGRKKNKIDTSKFYCKNLFDFAQFTLSKKISHIQLDLDLEKESNLRKLIFSDLLKDVALNYLNTKILSTKAVIFISNPVDGGISEIEKSENAQKFHSDVNFKKFFKLFIYLSDVSTNDGPHVFIPGSHKYKNKSHLIVKRYSDEEIYSSYDSKVEFTGKKGKIFFEDTFGFHKGEEPKNKCRVALVVEYGNDNIKYDESYLLNKFN